MDHGEHAHARRFDRPSTEKRCLPKLGRSIIGPGRGPCPSVDVGYGDPMALAGRLTGIVAGGFVVAILMAAGCQEQRAQAPAAAPEPVGSVPARASKERVEGVPPSNRGQDARDTTPRGVTTNETCSRDQARAGGGE